MNRIFLISLPDHNHRLRSVSCLRDAAVSEHTWSGSYIVWLFVSGFILIGCSQRKSDTPSNNRLISAASPYLREHADNPVNWYEWGEEALEKARIENKPLVISIGYASCHWCHVMERESFMDTAVARIMNENFISIKIDREERPDIDQIYLNAAQLISGNAGWPLNAFALPDGKPFYAGTYYPKDQWITMLTQITEDPPITSIDQHCIEMGNMAAEIFLEEIKLSSVTPFLPKKVVLMPELIIRESSLFNFPKEKTQSSQAPPTQQETPAQEYN